MNQNFLHPVDSLEKAEKESEKCHSLLDEWLADAKTVKPWGELSLIGVSTVSVKELLIQPLFTFKIASCKESMKSDSMWQPLGISHWVHFAELMGMSDSSEHDQRSCYSAFVCIV